MRARKELVAILSVALISAIVLGAWMIYAKRTSWPRTSSRSDSKEPNPH